MAKRKAPTGYCKVEYLNDDINGVDKGEVEIYHKSTADALVDKGIVKIIEVIKEYKPKAAK